MRHNIAVIFDMDGVIMDNNKYHERAWKQFCFNYKLELSDEELHNHVYGRIAKDTLDFIFKKDHSQDEIEKYVEEKELSYRKDYVNKIKLLSGLYEFLEELKRLNIPMALATSAPPGNIDFAFSHLPISHYFKFILCASDITKGKPHPEIYVKAIEKLKLKPTQCIVFEDSISGIRAALGAEAHVIGVSTTHKAEEMMGAELIINDFTEIDHSKLLSIL